MDEKSKPNVLDDFLTQWGVDAFLKDLVTAEMFMTFPRKDKQVQATYPRIFRLMRDRSDNPRARLGHVADGIEWIPGGQVTLRWKGPHVSVSTFNTRAAMQAVHGYLNPLTGRYDTRIEYVDPPKQLDKRLCGAVDHLYYALADYVDTTQKRAHVARKELQEAFGAVQDLMVEATQGNTVNFETMTPCA